MFDGKAPFLVLKNVVAVKNSDGLDPKTTLPVLKQLKKDISILPVYLKILSTNENCQAPS